MKLHDLTPAKGSKRSRKRIGRGPGSGIGKTAGRGHNGQRSRAGYSQRIGFEGGQMPLTRRVPKRGFTNIFRVSYQVVNLEKLADLEGEINPETLHELGMAKAGRPIKILGQGELSKAIEVRAHKFSASAKAKIEAAGGTCEVIDS